MSEWNARIDELGPEFAQRNQEHDDNDTFVEENYRELKGIRFFSAQVPADLGGGGVSHAEMCELLRRLATYCSSTALACSMHQHLVSAAVYNHLHGKPGRKLLEKVAADESVLVSTGANDWLESSGEVERVEGGFRVTAMKPFASGSPAGAIAVTSAPYEDPEEGWQVLHFPVPLSAEGASLVMNWKAHGMRGTGSNTLKFEGVFVPEESVVLRRVRGAYHPAWNVITTVALPLIGSAYLGVADAAAAIAREKAAKRPTDPVVPFLIGEMENERLAAKLAVDFGIRLANGWDFEPTNDNGNAALQAKTLAARACVATVRKAIEATGGAAYFRDTGLERLLRDVDAADFHPLPEKRQLRFTGRLAMGLDPIRD